MSKRLMHIKIRKEEDQARIKQFARNKGLPLTKAVVEAIKLANDVYWYKGKIASLQFLLKITKEEQKK